MPENLSNHSSSFVCPTESPLSCEESDNKTAGPDGIAQSDFGLRGLDLGQVTLVARFTVPWWTNGTCNLAHVERKNSSSPVS